MRCVYGGKATDLQASQAVFCLRGGGSVFASSWIWSWKDGVGRTRPGESMGGRRSECEYVGASTELKYLAGRTNGRGRGCAWRDDDMTLQSLAVSLIR